MGSIDWPAIESLLALRVAQSAGSLALDKAYQAHLSDLRSCAAENPLKYLVDRFRYSLRARSRSRSMLQLITFRDECVISYTLR